MRHLPGKTGRSSRNGEWPRAAFQRDINGLRGDVPREPGGDRRLSGRLLPRGTEDALVPGIVVAESEDAIVLTADLPGVTEAELDRAIRGHTRTLRARKRQMREGKETSYYVAERAYGRSARSVGLPISEDRDRASAGMAKGVLRVELPKLEAEPPKRIAVKHA